MVEADDAPDPALISEAVYANAFRTVKPSIVSTAIRTHALRFEAHQLLRDGRLGEEFLVNSRLRRRDVELELSVAGYFSDAGALSLALMGREGRKGARAIRLPASVPLRMGLGDVVRRRRSVRMYTGDSISLAHLATIARIAGGITGQIANLQGGAPISLRATPSGGGLYPVDLHFAACHIDGLPPGIYAYDPREDILWQTGDERNVEALIRSAIVSEDVISLRKASAFALLVGRPWRSMRKYGLRGMRYLFLEAGAIAEHLDLAVTALGLGCVDCGSLCDDEAHEAMGIDGVYEALLDAVVIGVPG